MAALDDLIQRHPRLFRGEHSAIVSWLPEGWASLVEELFNAIEALLDDGQAARLEIRQIKEKFGSLRVYTQMHPGSGATELSEADVALHRQVMRLVQAAEKRSSLLCDACGAPSELRSFAGWMTTRCDRCLPLRISPQPLTRETIMPVGADGI